jgi:hypothetical protein
VVALSSRYDTQQQFPGAIAVGEGLVAKQSPCFIIFSEPVKCACSNQ